MVPFTWLLLGHLAGDFLFQNRWMAENKHNNFFALIFHSLIYTFFVLLFSLAFGGLSFPGIIILIFTHILLDDRKIINWWTKNITKAQDKYLLMIIDQSLHLMILAVILHV